MCGSTRRGLRASWGTGESGLHTNKALKICPVSVPDNSFLAWFLILSFYPSTLSSPITKTLLLCPRCRSKCARWWTQRGSPSSPRWSAPSTRRARRAHRNQVSPSLSDMTWVYTFEQIVHVSDLTVNSLIVGTYDKSRHYSPSKSVVGPEKVGGASTCRKSRMPHRALFVVRKSKH